MSSDISTAFDTVLNQSTTEGTESRHDLLKRIAELEQRLAQSATKAYTFTPSVVTDKSNASKYGRLQVRLRNAPVPTFLWLSEVEDFLQNAQTILSLINQNRELMSEAEITYLASKKLKKNK